MFGQQFRRKDLTSSTTVIGRRRGFPSAAMVYSLKRLVVPAAILGGITLWVLAIIHIAERLL